MTEHDRQLSLAPVQAGQQSWQPSSWPGCGGEIKCNLSDFVVEEIPDLEPCGDGEFLWLWIEKSGVSTPWLAQEMAVRLQTRVDSIGYAGLKDEIAITRQWFSVPSSVCGQSSEQVLQNWSEPRSQILQMRRHREPQRTGSLHANRFQIRIRQLNPAIRSQDLEACTERLRQNGLFNFYGEQRFGNDGENALIGLQLLRDGPKAAARLPRQKSRFLLSAAQSYLFNHYLLQRLEAQGVLDPLAGDVLEEGEGFCRWYAPVSRDSAAQIPPITTITGPMWGESMRQARGTPGEWEKQALSAADLTPRHLMAWGRSLPGTRRNLVVALADLQAKLHPSEGTALLSFSLPPGSYATVVCAQFMRPAIGS